MKKNRDESYLIQWQHRCPLWLAITWNTKGEGCWFLGTRDLDKVQHFRRGLLLFPFFPFKRSAQQIIPQSMFSPEWTFLGPSLLLLVSCNRWPTRIQKKYVSSPILPYSILWLVSIIIARRRRIVTTTMTISTIICNNYRMFSICQVWL